MLRVARLADLTDARERHFGAKAQNLARLARRGLPVPDGFAIAFDEGRTALLDAEEQRTLRGAYDELRRRAGSAPSVAVRSSAAHEDGSERSFAGLYETLLDVEEARLVGAVERCLESRLGERVASYAGTGEEACGAMGVLVQLMVDADFAGVCFTRSPHSGRDIALEVVEGLGDALVSGERTPARASLTRDSLEVRVESDTGRVFERFGEERAREVARLSLEAEAELGEPADVEWAFDGTSCQILQARPITAEAGPRAALEQIRREEIDHLRGVAERAKRLLVFTDFSVADMIPRPSTLGLEILNLLSGPGGSIETSLGALGLRYQASVDCGDHYPSIGGRTYLNVTAALDSVDLPLPLALDESQLDFEDGGSLDFEQVPLRLAWPGWRTALRIPGAIARLLFVVAPRFLRLRPRFDREFRERVAPAVTAEAARLRELDVSGLSSGQLFETFRAYIERFVELHYHHQMADSFAFATHALLRRPLRQLYGDRQDSVEIALTTGLHGNLNTETNLDLARVAQGSLSLDAFLERYGHRGAPDYEISSPRWREEPERIDTMARTVARAGRDPLEQFEEQVRVREEAEARFSSDIRRNLWLRPWHGSILRELRYYQRYSPLREGTQGLCYHFVELARGVLLEAARRTGLGEVIFYLSMAELEGLLSGPASSALADELAARARARRERLRLARKLPLPHALHSGDLEAIGRPLPLPADARELSGVVVSAGTVRARARVAESLEEAQGLEAGEILVTVSADPSWTPLFLVAGGLVLEQGGLLSHPAIVAREYGLPAVVNVVGATRLLRTGQEITLDADAGRVLVPEAPPG